MIGFGGALDVIECVGGELVDWACQRESENALGVSNGLSTHAIIFFNYSKTLIIS